MKNALEARFRALGKKPLVFLFFHRETKATCTFSHPDCNRRPWIFTKSVAHEISFMGESRARTCVRHHRRSGISPYPEGWIFSCLHYNTFFYKHYTFLLEVGSFPPVGNYRFVIHGRKAKASQRKALKDLPCKMLSPHLLPKTGTILSKSSLSSLSTALRKTSEFS